MKVKISIVLFLLLVGLGDLSEHHFVCDSAGAELLPVSYTDEEIGRNKPDKELLPISYTDEEIGRKAKPERTSTMCKGG